MEAANQIAYPLKLLFKCSFNTSQLPAEWKYANIKLLHKKGSRMDIGNYRPVSLTIVRDDNVTSYFKSNKLGYSATNSLVSSKAVQRYYSCYR